jgi:hypothetical protein
MQLKSIGRTPSTKVMEEYVQELDPEHTGVVDFDKLLVKLNLQSHKHKPKKNEVVQIGGNETTTIGVEVAAGVAVASGVVKGGVTVSKMVGSVMEP